MRNALLLVVSAVSMVTGTVRRCHLCKTENAADLFANLHCDAIPETAPDCSLTTRGSGNNFFQHCPENSNCLTITKQDEELRLCTQKQRLETMKTTDGVVMEVCDSDMCNAAGRDAPLTSLALLLALISLLTQQLL